MHSIIEVGRNFPLVTEIHFGKHYRFKTNGLEVIMHNILLHIAKKFSAAKLKIQAECGLIKPRFTATKYASCCISIICCKANTF